MTDEAWRLLDVIARRDYQCTRNALISAMVEQYAAKGIAPVAARVRGGVERRTHAIYVNDEAWALIERMAEERGSTVNAFVGELLEQFAAKYAVP